MTHSADHCRLVNSRFPLTLAILGLLCGTVDSVAQDSGTKAPASMIDMQTGLWAVAITTTVTGYKSKQFDESLAKFPDQRSKYLAAIIGKTSVQKANYCQRADDLAKGNVLNILNGCKDPQINATSHQLTLHCGGSDQPNEATYQIERVDSARVQGTARVSTHGDPALDQERKIEATFLAANCAAGIHDIQQASFIANGADPDMLSFLPPNSGQGEVKFHGLFSYGWAPRSQNCQTHVTTKTGDHCVMVPFIDAPGGLPGLAYGYVEVKVNGTDGQALYLTAFPNSKTSFTSPRRFRVDKTGKVSEISDLPATMHGGFGPNAMGQQ